MAAFLWLSKMFLTGKILTSREKDDYEYEVLGGTHLTLATKHLHAQYPENKQFLWQNDKDLLWSFRQTSGLSWCHASEVIIILS